MRTIRMIALPWLVVLLVGGVSGCRDGGAAAEELTEWRFAIEEIQGSVQDLYAREFKKIIEKETEGKIKVTVYPYGSLGTSDQVTEQLAMGAIQFAMASPGHLGKLIPELQLFLLHFIFSEDNQVNRRVLGESEKLYRAFGELYAERGLKLLAFYPEGWQAWTTLQPVRKPADFRGLKMRVMTSPMLIEAYKAYDANPTPLPYSEVYSALQLKMIDGQVNPVFAIEEMSFYEVTDYLIFPKHAQFVTSTVTNPEFFATLEPEMQRLVDETVRELNDFIFDVQAEFNQKRLARIRKRKPELEILRLTEKEREAFREKSLEAREAYVDMVGPRGEKLLDLLLSEIRRVEREMS